MWLKRSTAQNIVIGGGAGAFPPVIGWAAVTGNTPVDAWLLFGHDLPLDAAALLGAVAARAQGIRQGRRADAAGHARRCRVTRHQILVYTLVLVPVSLLPLATGLGGWIYGATALGLGGVFLAYALRLLRSNAGDASATGADMKLAKTTFVFSILYLFALFGAVLVEHAAGLHFPLTGV
jgi:heme o synthase